MSGNTAYNARERYAASLPRGPLWLPRGVRVGSWSGGTIAPLRPPSLLRPPVPGRDRWLCEGAAAPLVEPAQLTRPAHTLSKPIALTLERAAKRARGGVASRERAEFLRFFPCGPHRVFQPGFEHADCW